jgi:hypothetical protein
MHLRHPQTQNIPETLKLRVLIGRILGGMDARRQRKRVARRMDVAQIKQLMVNSLEDCNDTSAARMRYLIHTATRASDLWLVRSDLYQYLANTHSQTEAALRINKLCQCFVGWMPQSQISQV